MTAALVDIPNLSNGNRSIDSAGAKPERPRSGDSTFPRVLSAHHGMTDAGASSDKKPAQKSERSGDHPSVQMATTEQVNAPTQADSSGQTDLRRVEPEKVDNGGTQSDSPARDSVGVVQAQGDALCPGVSPGGHTVQAGADASTGGSSPPDSTEDGSRTGDGVSQRERSDISAVKNPANGPVRSGALDGVDTDQAADQPAGGAAELAQQMGEERTGKIFVAQTMRSGSKRLWDVANSTRQSPGAPDSAAKAQADQGVGSDGAKTQRSEHLPQSIEVKSVETVSLATPGMGEQVTGSVMPGTLSAFNEAPGRMALASPAGDAEGSGRPLDAGSSRLQEFAQGLVKELAFRQVTRGEEQAVRLRLETDALGTIRVDIALHERALRAEFVTMDPTVKALLDNNQAPLREVLTAQGFQVASFSVSIGHPGSSSSGSGMPGGSESEENPRSARESRADTPSSDEKWAGGDRSGYRAPQGLIDTYV